MSHTPGPWEAIDNRQVVTVAEVETGRTYGYGCENDFVCDLNDGEYHEYRNEKEQAANARLIAAAPELLEALKGEATEIDGRLCWCTQPNMIKYRGHDSGCESNRDLVAKATGEGS